MITGIAIENFKGIRERIEVKLKPLTLLFGPNSAGKSTILHALHYAREVFERHNLDADRTITGGDFVDLGGFGSFVHGHDLGRPIRLQINMRLTEDDLPDYPSEEDYNPYDDLEGLYGGITDGWAAVTVAWSELLGAPFVAEYEVGYNSQPFARLTVQPGRRGAELADMDVNHPILVQRKDLPRFTEYEAWEPSEEDDGTYSGLLYLLNKVRRASHVEAHEDVFMGEPIGQQPDALPQWGKRLGLPDFRDDASPHWDNSPLDASDREELWSDNREINAILSRLVVGPGELLRDRLREFRYLGPLRKTPPRLYSPPRFPDPSRWASGLGAWDVLCGDAEELVRQVNDWLSDSERLDTGYRILLQNYKELDLQEPLVIQLLTGRAFDEADNARLDLESLPTQSRLTIVPNGSTLELRPHDVGVGISQIVPVVVTALDATPGLSSIEQPELHVHPRVQAEMGDLFIEAALERKRSFLIETHSEHLVLRLQRRIRQTGKGEPNKGIPVTGNDVAVYFVNQEDGQTKIGRIDIDKNGEFIQPWPDDFFEVDFYERFQ